MTFKRVDKTPSECDLWRVIGRHYQEVDVVRRSSDQRFCVRHETIAPIQDSGARPR
jgi:hypothetical protein